MTIQKIKTLLQTDVGITLLIALSWQVVMTILGALYRQHGGVLDHTIIWDGTWYLNIIQDHYVHNQASAVFYPLFPGIVQLLHTLSFGLLSYSFIGLLVNTVALWFALWGLTVIAQKFTIKRRFLVVGFFLLAPTAIFLHLFYTEALFAALGFWAYAFALQKRWLWVGIMLALLTACRLPSLLFVLLCALEYWRSYSWNIKRAINKNVLYFLLAPIGFMAYGLYLLALRGDFFAMFHAYKVTQDWAYQVFQPNFLHTIGRATLETIHAVIGKRPFDSDIFINHALPLLGIFTLLACSLYLLYRVRKRGIPLGIVGLVSIVFFTLNNNLVSVHRYTLPCLGIYLVIVMLYEKHRKLRPVIISVGIAAALLQCFLLALLFNGTFIG